MISLSFAATLPTWTALGRTWLDVGEYSHGFLVAAICLGWLIVRLRHLGDPDVGFGAAPAKVYALAMRCYQSCEADQLEPEGLWRAALETLRAAHKIS